MHKEEGGEVKKRRVKQLTVLHGMRRISFGGRGPNGILFCIDSSMSSRDFREWVECGAKDELLLLTGICFFFLSFSFPNYNCLL
jgi:hypothetical protein